VTQVARESGAYVIGTGRAADRQAVLDLGAHEFLDLDNDDLDDIGGSEQQVPEADLDSAVSSRASMIARRGPQTRHSEARPRAELAGAARPLRHRGTPRSSHCGTSSPCCAAPPSPEDFVARPRRAQRAEPTASSPATPDTTRLTPNAAALARPTRRLPLDLPAPTTRPTTHRTPDSSASTADGPREPSLGYRPLGGSTRPH
jgi:hypothetical protein